MAAQQTAGAATEVNGKLSWTGDAQMYIVLKNGEFFALTNEKSLNLEGATGTFTVRAANEMGGLGEATEATTSTGIENITTPADVLSTKIYSADGVQVSKLQKGINIVEKTMSDGSKKTSKIIIK